MSAHECLVPSCGNRPAFKWFLQEDFGFQAATESSTWAFKAPDGAAALNRPENRCLEKTSTRTREARNLGVIPYYATSAKLDDLCQGEEKFNLRVPGEHPC